MNGDMKTAAIVRYEKPFASAEKAVRLSGAFDSLRCGDTVFVKPNVVYWPRVTPAPPWGVVTTTRVVEDVVKLLKDCGARRIVIGEGVITSDPNDRETPARAFETLGYNRIAKKYGVSVVDVMDREFRKVELGGGTTLNFSVDLLDSDMAVSLPVLKTHAQTMVSLSLKNLKGCLDMKSRKQCHSDCSEKDLDHHVAMLANALPNLKICAVTDGIYTLERGPVYTGKARRSDILIASGDLLTADIAGAAALGFDPSGVPHLAKCCKAANIDPGIDSIRIVGEPLDKMASRHQWDFPYNKRGDLPLIMERMGITGLSFPKYDHSLCSYCSLYVGFLQSVIARAWKKVPFDKVEILTGKIRRPSPGMNHTILFGKCQVSLNKNHPDIFNPIHVPGCPPRMDKLAAALGKAGIGIDPSVVDDFENMPALFMSKYENKPGFSMDFHRCGENG